MRGALLTNEEYAGEKKILRGNPFRIPFVSEMGTEYFEKELYSKMPNYARSWGWTFNGFLDRALRRLFQSSSRGHRVGDHEDLRSRSMEMADRLKLRYEERQGTLQGLRDCLQGPRPWPTLAG